jgi:uncharacterized lipoprotein
MAKVLLITLVLVLLLFQGCTDESKAGQKNQTTISIAPAAPTPTPIVQVPRDFISDQLDKSLDELVIVG